MIEIKFFDYPDKFSISPLPGESIAGHSPCGGYYFRVVAESINKELSWSDCITRVVGETTCLQKNATESLCTTVYMSKKDDKADKLRELIGYIENIIVSKEEYKKLPARRGGYL